MARFKTTTQTDLRGGKANSNPTAQRSKIIYRDGVAVGRKLAPRVKVKNSGLFVKTSVLRAMKREDVKGSVNLKRWDDINKQDEISLSRYRSDFNRGMRRTNGIPVEKEAKLKQSIITTMNHLTDVDPVIRERILNLDNGVLNKMHQISPNLLEAVYIYEYRESPIEGVYMPPERGEQLERIIKAYDIAVEELAKGGYL